MLGKELGFLDADFKEPERPDISIIKRYSDKPKSGLDFNPNTSVFKSQYDRDEALGGTFGARAAYLASQEVHSQGLRAKDPSLGIEDTSYFGSNLGPVEAVTNLVTTGTVQGDDNNNNDDGPTPTPTPTPQQENQQPIAENIAPPSRPDDVEPSPTVNDDDAPPSYDYGSSGPFYKGGII